MEKRPYSEIATELGCSKKSVANLEKRLLKKLRESKLAKFAIYVEDDPDPTNGRANNGAWRRDRWY